MSPKSKSRGYDFDKATGTPILDTNRLRVERRLRIARNSILGLFAIAAGGGALWGLPKLAHKLHPHISTGSGKPAAVPMYHPPAGKNIIDQINAVNQKYVAWVDQQVHRAVPEIPATGPNAGTLTPAVLNSPGVLKKWPGPKVPTSLKGIPIPKNTPANGAIVGLSPSALAHYTAEAKKYWPNITQAQVKAAMTRAARFVLAGGGNGAMKTLPFFDSALYKGEFDQAVMSKTNPLLNITGPASKGGMLPLRQVNYRAWVSFAPPGSSSHPTIQSSSIALNQPNGHVRFANFMVNNVIIHVIGTGMYQGKLRIGKFSASSNQIVEGMVSGANQSQWYMWGSKPGQFTNKPNPIYWSKP